MTRAKIIDRERDHARVAARRAERRAAKPEDFEILGVLVAMFVVILILVVTLGVSPPF